MDSSTVGYPFGGFGPPPPSGFGGFGGFGGFCGLCGPGALGAFGIGCFSWETGLMLPMTWL